MGTFISLFCTLSLAHSHAHAHMHTFTHMHSLLTRRQPHPLQLQLMSSTMQRTGTRTSSHVSGLDRLGMQSGESNVRVSMCQRYHMQVIHTVLITWTLPENADCTSATASTPTIFAIVNIITDYEQQCTQFAGQAYQQNSKESCQPRQYRNPAQLSLAPCRALLLASTLHANVITSVYENGGRKVVSPLHETSVRAVKKTMPRTHTCKVKKASLWLSSGKATKQEKPRNVEVSIFVLLALGIIPSASIAHTIFKTFIQKWVISPSDVKKVELFYISFNSHHNFPLHYHNTALGWPFNTFHKR